MKLSRDQLAAVKQVASEGDKHILPCLAKFGRGFISDYRFRESDEEHHREMQRILDRVVPLIKDRDDRILRKLNGEQNQCWRTMQGAAFQIHWAPWKFFTEPFNSFDNKWDR